MKPPLSKTTPIPRQTHPILQAATQSPPRPACGMWPACPPDHSHSHMIASDCPAYPAASTHLPEDSRCPSPASRKLPPGLRVAVTSVLQTQHPRPAPAKPWPPTCECELAQCRDHRSAPAHFPPHLVLCCHRCPVNTRRSKGASLGGHPLAPVSPTFSRSFSSSMVCLLATSS